MRGIHDRAKGGGHPGARPGEGGGLGFRNHNTFLAMLASSLSIVAPTHTQAVLPGTRQIKHGSCMRMVRTSSVVERGHLKMAQLKLVSVGWSCCQVVLSEMQAALRTGRTGHAKAITLTWYRRDARRLQYQRMVLQRVHRENHSDSIAAIIFLAGSNSGSGFGRALNPYQMRIRIRIEHTSGSASASGAGQPTWHAGAVRTLNNNYQELVRETNRS